MKTVIERILWTNNGANQKLFELIRMSGQFLNASETRKHFVILHTSRLRNSRNPEIALVAIRVYCDCLIQFDSVACRKLFSHHHFIIGNRPLAANRNVWSGLLKCRTSLALAEFCSL